MAYGLVCRNCGHQEAEHFSPEDVVNRRINGYRCDVFDCPGFEYRVRDHSILVMEHIADMACSIPDGLIISASLRERLEAHLLLVSEHYEKRGDGIIAWREFVGGQVQSGNVRPELVQAFHIHDYQQLGSTVLV